MLKNFIKKPIRFMCKVTKPLHGYDEPGFLYKNLFDQLYKKRRYTYAALKKFMLAQEKFQLDKIIFQEGACYVQKNNLMYAFPIELDYLHSGGIGDYCFKGGDRDQSAINICKKILSEYENPVFVDVGANIGQFSLPLSILDGLKICSFEPDPRAFNVMQKNIELNNLSNISLYQKAISNVVGHINIDTNMPFQTTQIGKGSVKVSVSTLDEELFERFSRIHLVKADIQGAEGLMLKGMRKIVKRDQPILYLEFCYLSLDYGITKHDLINTLLEFGYTHCIELNDFKNKNNELLELGKTLQGGNYFFFNKNRHNFCV